MGARLSVIAALPVLISLLTFAGESRGHGGYPLRLAVREDPGLVLLGHMVLTYLREGQGMNVDPVFLEDGERVRNEYAGGKIDLFLDAPPESWAARECRDDAGGGAQAERYFTGAFPGAWKGIFAFSLGASPCSRPALAAHERVVKDLRFSLLRETLERFVAAVTAADVAAVRELSDGSARSSVAAARKVLGRKGLL